MRLQLITLAGVQVNEDVYEIELPTESGPIAVFAGHEPLVSLAKPGAIAIRSTKDQSDDKRTFFAIGGGVIDIDQSAVTVLVDEADHGDDIVEADAKKALEKALAMQKNAKNAVELEKASALVDRHRVRLDVAGLRRRRRS